MPAGRLSSRRERPYGSSLFGTPPQLKAIEKILLISECWAYFPFVLLQDKPWCSLYSTGLPQMHRWDSHTRFPRRSATAILAESLSTRRPDWGDGTSWSHFVDILDDDASSWARSVGPLNDSNSSISVWHLSLSHALCDFYSMVAGVHSNGYDSIIDKNSVFTMCKSDLAKMWLASLCDSLTDEKYAEWTRLTVLLTRLTSKWQGKCGLFPRCVKFSRPPRVWKTLISRREKIGSPSDLLDFLFSFRGIHSNQCKTFMISHSLK